jgi:DNA-binding beta-propeller fold protein YncE
MRAPLLFTAAVAWCGLLLPMNGVTLASPPLLVVSANDQASGYAGKMFVRPQARPGSVSVIDLSVTPVRAWNLEGVPCSVVGPPSCVAMNASGSEILVTAALQPDPDNPGRLREDTRLTRLRWSAEGLQKRGEIEVGLQTSGLALGKDARRVWVALRGEGAVGLVNLEEDGMRLEGKWTLATPAESLSDIELSPDERTAFATLHATDTLLVLRVGTDGSLTETQRLSLPRGAYHIGFFPDGKRALVGCTRDSVLCLLEEHAGVWRVQKNIATGRMPEGVEISPDGRWVAATCFDGANIIDPQSRWYGKPSGVHLYAVRADGRLERTQTLNLTGVLQGSAFTADSRKLVVGQFGPGNLCVFELANDEWHDTGLKIEIPGQSATLVGSRP